MSIENQAKSSPGQKGEDVNPRVAAYVRHLEEHTQQLLSKVNELEGVSLRRLLTRGGKLLQHYHVLNRGFAHPQSMLDSDDVLDLYKRAARIRQVEMALGRKLVNGLDLKMSDEERDALCARVGFNLIGEFHADQIDAHYREIEMWKSGNRGGLLRSGCISYDDHLELKEVCPEGNAKDASEQETRLGFDPTSSDVG